MKTPKKIKATTKVKTPAAKHPSDRPKSIYLVLRADYSTQNLDIGCLRFKTLEEAKTMLRGHHKSLKAQWTGDHDEFGSSLDISPDGMTLSMFDSQESTATTWVIKAVDVDDPIED
jgi:hypothetical protein